MNEITPDDIRSAIQAGFVTGYAQDSPQGAEASKDHVVKRFRLLTADEVIRPTMGWMPVSMKIPADVLQASLPLWSPNDGPLVVYADHEVSVRSWVGEIMDTEWSDGDHPGIDGRIKFHRQADPSVAYGYESGVLRAVSAGFSVEWEQSHKDMDRDAFFQAVWKGLEKDGEPVCVVATKITEVKEVSAVWRGADRRALAKAQAHFTAGSTPAMEADLKDSEIRAALGLPEDADVLTKVNAVVAELGAMRAKAEEMESRAVEAETSLNELQTAALNAKREGLVDGAIKAGKIRPESRDRWLKFACADYETTQAELDSIKAKAVPVGRLPAGDATPVVAGSKNRVFRSLGITPEMAAKYERATAEVED